MLICTCLANGQTLSRDFLRYLGLQTEIFDLCVVSGARNTISHEIGKNENLHKILDFVNEDLYFIDSDVILLDKDTLHKLKTALLDFPAVTIPSKPEHNEANFPLVMPHACSGIRKELIPELRRHLKGSLCSYCELFKKIKPHVLWDTRAIEVKSTDYGDKFISR